MTALLYDDRSIDPQTTGLYFCDTPEDTYALLMNACCLQSGKTLYQLTPEDKNFLRQFPWILVCSPDSDKRRKTSAFLSEELDGCRVLAPPEKAFNGCRALSDMPLGPVGIGEALLENAEEAEVCGLVDFADIVREKRPVVSKSGIKALDKMFGGFGSGEVTVITGRRGEGKSTFISQMAWEAVSQGEKVCVYSGELTGSRYKDWALLQAAGPAGVERATSTDGFIYWVVPPTVESLITDWERGRLYLVDNGYTQSNNIDRIIRLFSIAANRMGCTMFIADNLMTIGTSGGGTGDYLRDQSEITGKLVSFAKANNVHLQLVAHPRKTEKGKRLSSDDVGGSGDITNRADNVMALEKHEEDGVSENVLRITKNRNYGTTGEIALQFDKSCRRYYQTEEERTRMYGWEPSLAEQTGIS